MAVEFHVNGPAIIKVGTGAAGALETLGVTEDGARIQSRMLEKKVVSDTFGPEMPADVQDFGQTDRVVLTLVKWDHVVLTKVLARRASGTEGAINSPGRLKGASGDFIRLLIDGAEPRNYLAARLIDQQEINKGTVYSKFMVAFECIPYSSSIGDVGGTVLYNAVTA